MRRTIELLRGMASHNDCANAKDSCDIAKERAVQQNCGRRGGDPT
jgi:hypothetical protein